MAGLRWIDVDFAAGTIRVQRSLTVVPGYWGDSPTKTRSDRTVMLDAETSALLEDTWRSAAALAERCGIGVGERREGYVFAIDPTGVVAWRPDRANAWWERARDAAGLPNVRLHDLRHFQATQLLDAGIPVLTVAARLGHADGTTTMKVYAHRTARADEAAAHVVAALLSRRDPDVSA